MTTKWESNVQLKDICDPYYRMAKELSKNIKVTENDGKIIIESPVGCERYGQTENGGKQVSFPADGTTYKGDIMVCKNCKIAKRTVYCPLKLAQYIKYMEKYEPEEKIRQRNKRKTDILLSMEGYDLLPKSPFSFSAQALDDIYIDQESLISAKWLLDKVITIPFFNRKENYIDCSFKCPQYIANTLTRGILDLTQARNFDLTNVKDEDEDTVTFDIRLPNNPNITKQIFVDSLCGKNHMPGSVSVVLYVIIAYSLLQEKMFLPYLINSHLTEILRTKRITQQFGYPLPPLLKAKNRFYGLLQTNDTAEDETIPMDIASHLRTKCGLTLPIHRMSMMEFSELFVSDIKDGHSDNLSVSYNEPESDTMYVLTGVSDFLDYLPMIKKNGATYDRAKIMWATISFFEKMMDGYFILICGTEKELNHFVKACDNFTWLFGKERLKIKDYTDKEIAKIMHERYPSVTIKKAISFLKEHKDEFPLKNEKLIGYLGNYYETHKEFPTPEKKDKSYQEELDELTGLENIKEQAKRLCNLWKYMKTGKEKGLTFPAINTHMLFKGNPGTGKTTVARIIANAMYDYGACKERKLVEVHCPDLVAGYVGQTALKTRKKIEKAIGGVLFVDEAYALTQARGGFGDESLAVLVKMMEDHRDELTVIFAGYSKEMEDFLDANPGLRSRIGYTFDFKDYTKEELADIFENKMKSCHFTVTKEAKEKAKEIIEKERNKPFFGNGRFVDKIVQETIMEKAQKDNFSAKIEKDDIPEAKLLGKYNEKKRKDIGFEVKHD